MTNLSLAEKVEGRFWLELREPGCVPERKGPWPQAQIATVLREFMAARPEAFISVVTVSSTGEPFFQDGPEALMMVDGRSMSTARRHLETTREAFATLRDTGNSDDR